jgi:hypothetical protein
MRLLPIKDTARWEQTVQLPQLFACQLTTVVAAALKFADICSAYLHLFILIEFQRFGYSGGQPDGRLCVSNSQLTFWRTAQWLLPE